MNACVAFVAGLLFGAGLIVSGMTDPGRVVGFLDVGGAWKPGLAFTMAGAIAVAYPAFAWVRRQGRSVRGHPIVPIDRMRIDARLIGGAAVFGLGWGLSGICPGPAVLLLASLDVRAVVFAFAMLGGALLVGIAQRLPARERQSRVLRAR